MLNAQFSTASLQFDTVEDVATTIMLLLLSLRNCHQRYQLSCSALLSSLLPLLLNLCFDVLTQLSALPLPSPVAGVLLHSIAAITIFLFVAAYSVVSYQSSKDTEHPPGHVMMVAVLGRHAVAEVLGVAVILGVKIAVKINV